MEREADKFAASAKVQDSGSLRRALPEENKAVSYCCDPPTDIRQSEMPEEQPFRSA